MKPIHLNKICKITNVTCHWNLENFEENITVTIGSDSLIFKKGFWDFEFIKKELKTKSVDLQALSFDNTCTVYHASEDINLKNLGPYLGFTKDKTISGGSKETSPKSVNLFKGLSMIEIRGNFVDINKNLVQGYFSNLMTRIPIDTKQILNGNITTYQPWSSSPISSYTVNSLEFEIKDDSELQGGYTLYAEMEFLWKIKMASTVAGGIFNAFAFAGASWIFSHVDHGNYQQEQKRHDLAVEKLQREQGIWEREEREKYDKMQQKQMEMKEATSDLAAGSKALDQYYKLTHQYEDHLRKKPTLDYTPSTEFQKYLTGVKVIIIGGCVYVGNKYIF